MNILPLGYQYRIISWHPRDYRGVALAKQGEEFVVLFNYYNALLVLTSAEMRWKRLKNVPAASCSDLVTYRGRLYAAFLNGGIFIINPYSLEATPLMLLQLLNSSSLNYLVPSGNDELFLVDKIIPTSDVINFSRLACRVSRLDEEAGKWIMVSDLGDRVLFIGEQGNVSCSAKELPDGCGMSGNSILFNNVFGYVHQPLIGGVPSHLDGYKLERLYSKMGHVYFLFMPWRQG